MSLVNEPLESGANHTRVESRRDHVGAVSHSGSSHLKSKRTSVSVRAVQNTATNPSNARVKAAGGVVAGHANLSTNGLHRPGDDLHEVRKSPTEANPHDGSANLS